MIDRNDFLTRRDLADHLAAVIGDALQQAIANRGRASLALSGGSTPALLFQTLARNTAIDWPRVTVTLIDERWVDDRNERSNAALVATHLLRGAAASARFVPLFSGGSEPDAGAITRTNTALGAIAWPLDAAVLGMGSDGHTASFFPGGDNLDAAFESDGPAIAMRAPGAGEPRITLTLKRIIGARHLFLHIEGAGKRDVLAAALAEPGDFAAMPVRAVLAKAPRPVAVYWCP